MVSTPGVFPVTIPVVETEDTDKLLVLQVPPSDASDRNVVAPGQAVNVPVITAGNGLTDAVMVVKQLPSV